MKIFVKVRATEGISAESSRFIRTLALAQHADEIEALNCTNVWIEVERRDGEYFPVHFHQSAGLFIPKAHIEDKMIIF